MVLFPHRNMIPHQSTYLLQSRTLGFQREVWWLPVPCISSGGYIQASATWHFWSVGLSALLSNHDLQLCWLLVTVGASGVCTRCLTLHLAAVLCHGKCPVSSKPGILSGACMASFSQPAPKWGSCVFQWKTPILSNSYSDWLFPGVSSTEK